MTHDLVLRGARLTSGAAAMDIGVTDGRIAAVELPGNVVGTQERELGGRVVLPALVEPHLHLDKAYLPASGASLADAIAQTAVQKRGFTVPDVRERAERVLRCALAAGTTTIRAQTEVDPGVGLLSVGVLAELADEHRDWLTLQIAVFPQEGIFARPGTLDLMRAALREPGRVVGGCPYAEVTLDDARAHVDTVLDLAAAGPGLADLHLDFADGPDDPRFTLAQYVAEATVQRGLQGRVAIGHVTSLLAHQTAVLDALAAADVAVVMLPATDLFLNGRADGRRGLAPWAALRAAGVRVALSSNNVRNAFTPTGRVDPLDIALLLARTAHVSTADGFAALLDAVTVDAASIVDPAAPRGIVVGAPANLVVLDSLEPADVLLDQPDRQAVYARGRLVHEEARVSWSVLDDHTDPAPRPTTQEKR